MAILFYEYAKCSTCVKARKWLEKKGVEFTTIPIAEKPPGAKLIESYMEKSGLEPKKFFNTSGVVYREEKISAKLPGMSRAEMAAKLATNGRLIKRPILVDGDAVYVGFNETAYARHFK